MGLRLVESAPPVGSDTLQYELAGGGTPGSLRLWPQEGVSVDGRFEPVRRSQITDLGIDAAGVVSYQVVGLAEGMLELGVRLVPAATRLELVYQVTNRASRTRFVTVAPCLQLPAEAFGGLSGWARTKRVLVVTEDGPRWISDTEQTRGLARPGEPDPGESPWAQHFRPLRRGAREASPPDGLALFGVARERVPVDAIVASWPDSDLLVGAIADSRIGVTYGLLDCLRAGVGGSVRAGATETFRERIVLSRRPLDELLGAEVPELGSALVAEASFVPPGARAEPLESFERGVPRGWSAAGGTLAPARPRHGFRAPTDGAAQLEAVLSPTVVLESPEFTISASPARPSWLSLDVSAAGLEPEPEVALTLVGPDGERSVDRPLAHGKPRRFVIAVPDEWLGAPLHVRLGLHGTSAPRRLVVDAFTLHRLAE